MKNIHFKIFCIILLSNLLFSCSQEENDELDELYNNTEFSWKMNYSEIELEILNLVNNHRVSIGLNSLERLDSISSVALSHSEYMVSNGKASHDNFSYRVSRLREMEMAEIVSENVAFGHNTAKSVFSSWLNSDGHKKNLENAVLTHFGISVVSDNSKRNYFTNIFISK